MIIAVVHALGIDCIRVPFKFHFMIVGYFIIETGNEPVVNNAGNAHYPPVGGSETIIITIYAGRSYTGFIIRIIIDNIFGYIFFHFGRIGIGQGTPNRRMISHADSQFIDGTKNDANFCSYPGTFGGEIIS